MSNDIKHKVDQKVKPCGKSETNANRKGVRKITSNTTANIPPPK